MSPFNECKKIKAGDSIKGIRLKDETYYPNIMVTLNDYNSKLLEVLDNTDNIKVVSYSDVKRIDNDKPPVVDDSIKWTDNDIRKAFIAGVNCERNTPNEIDTTVDYIKIFLPKLGISDVK